MRTIRRLAATLTLLALLTACQTPEPETPTATIAAPSTQGASTPASAASPSPTPSPSPVDYTIPAVIDESYVQRIVTALYDVESKAVQDMVAAGEVTPEVEAVLNALYRTDLVEAYLTSYRESAADGFPEVLQSPGAQAVRLDQVFSAKPNCIFASATRDFGDVLVEPNTQAGITYVQFLLKPAAQDPTGLNPTPWIIGGNILRADESVPEDQCADF